MKRQSVPYMGHVFTLTGPAVCPKKIEAILKMRSPSDRQGVLLLLGMVAHLAWYVSGFSEMTSPLREFLEKENEFVWDDAVHGKALAKLKMILSNAPVLQYFDVNKASWSVFWDGKDAQLCLREKSQGRDRSQALDCHLFQIIDIIML